MTTNELDKAVQEAQQLADTLNNFGHPFTGVDTIDDALGGLTIITLQDNTHVVGVSWGTVEVDSFEGYTGHADKWSHFVTVI